MRHGLRTSFRPGAGVSQTAARTALLDRDGEIKLTISNSVPAADLAPALAAQLTLGRRSLLVSSL